MKIVCVCAGSRGSTSNESEKPSQSVIPPEDVQPIEGSVARMTFSSTKVSSSGFTPDKVPANNSLGDAVEKEMVKKNLLSQTDVDEAPVVRKNDNGLELPAAASGALTPKKDSADSSRSASPAPTPKASGK